MKKVTPSKFLTAVEGKDKQALWSVCTEQINTPKMRMTENGVKAECAQSVLRVKEAFQKKVTKLRALFYLP